MTDLCNDDDSSFEQRLLKNMGALQVILDLLQVPYDKKVYHLYIRQVLPLIMYMFFDRMMPRWLILCIRLTGFCKIFVMVMKKIKCYYIVI